MRSDSRRGEDHGLTPAWPSEWAWIVLSPSAVPPEWRSRGRKAVMVPLSPEDVRGLVSGSSTLFVGSVDRELAFLLVAGVATREIAARTRVSVRTVQRRIARLRRQAGVRTTWELRARLATEEER